MDLLMGSRRRATKEELEQGEKEMKAAQERMTKEMESSGVLQIEDEGQQTERFESPHAALKDAARGSEEGPRGSPKTFMPPSPGTATSQELLAIQEKAQRPEAEAEEKTEVKSPKPSSKARKTPDAREDRGGDGVMVVTDPKDGDSNVDVKGISNGPTPQQGQPGRSPESSAVITPGPLFDDQQLRRFQELYAQAPWLYPGGQIPVPPPPFQHPIARPLFLEQDERRLQGNIGVGDQTPFVFPYMPSVGPQEGVEWRKELRELMDENRKLRSRIEVLEKGTEEPKFSTPEGHLKEAGTTKKEAETPTKEAENPKKEAEATKGKAETTKGKAETPKKEAERPPKEGETVLVMLKLMEGMQALQKQMMDGKDDEGATEAVRHAPALPSLPEWSSTTGPIDLNDWMALIEPMMSDLSNSSGQWWQLLVQEAQQWYERHMQLPPLERVAHLPKPSSELAKQRWARLERRASTLLLMAVPEPQREELISSKRLTALSIICQLLVIYQPGGLAEKELILRSLEQPPESANLSEAVQNLRKWSRWRRRAADLRISEPDPFLLLKGLNRMIKKPLELNRDLSFRISLARSTLQVDSTPTSTSVASFALHLIAEFEQVVHQEATNAPKKKSDPEKPKVAKLKKLEEERTPTKREDNKEEKGKCRFYLSDTGCRRGKTCQWSHDQKDEKRRCWNCGSPEHMSPACTRPKATGDASPTRLKAQKVEGEESSPSSSRGKEEEGSQEQASMKELLEQANRMLKSLTSTTSTTTASASPTGSEPRDEVVDRLQQQINSLKMKVFKLSKVTYGSSQGLLDSGATHALRPARQGESLESYKTVPVTLANGQSTQLHMTPGGVMVSKRANIEPILPMGLLIQRLGCKVDWGEEGVYLHHPKRGTLPIKLSSGCPQLARSLTLDLIEELEKTAVLGKIEERSFKEEVEWMRQLIETHPVLRQLPQHIKSRLAVQPGPWSDLPANRRTRKRFQRDGFIAHLFAGEDTGFTLSRAWHQQGGGGHALLEIDIKRGQNHDLLQDVGPYPSLMRAALEGKLLAVVGGPNCRSRSVLRHYEIPGQPNCPRPLREWGGGEYGKEGLTAAEISILHEDDVLLWRMVFLAMVSNYIKKARKDPNQVGFSMEQPASPRDYMPETVSFWDTKEWASLKKEFGWEETTFQQGAMGGSATKPTTFGGNLVFEINKHKKFKEGKEKGEIKTSKDLSRWAPGVMSMVAEALMLQVMKQQPKLRPLSWDEHIAHGHVPYRRDCAVCQQTMQQCHPHRKVPYPVGGVLSLDVAGPLIPAKDIGGLYARWMLVGTLTWAVPSESNKLKDPEVPKVEGDEPQFEVYPEEDEKEEEQKALEDLEEEKGKEEGAEEQVRVWDDEDDGDDGEKGKDDDPKSEGGGPPPPPYLLPPPERKEGDPESGPGGFDIKIFRLVSPMITKTAREVTKTTMEFLLKLKMDGFHVGRIHSDRGHEFSGQFRRWATERGILLTRTPGDDPRANGRVEVAVKSIKTQIRRLLKQAEVGSEMWPLAARYADALNRCWRIGDTPAFPPFLQEILVRRRTWRRGVFEPTVEKVKYFFPAPEEHGHWVQPEDERPRVTKYVMRKALEPITDQRWVAIEKEVADALTTRRRLREKTTVRKMEVEEKKTEGQDEDEEKFQRQKLRLSQIIEEEMKLMISDHHELAMEELKWIAKMKKMMEEPTEEDEILQTRVISTKEVAHQ